MKNKLILAISLILIAMPQGLAQEMRDPFIPIYPPDQTGIPASITQTQTTTNIQEPIFNQKIIKLASIDAKEAMQQLQQVGSSLLSPKGTVNYHQLTNSLLVKDLESRLPLIEEWVKQLDTPKQQVQITAHIISSSRMALQELGLEWGMLSGSPNNSRYQHYNRYSSRSGEFNFNLLNIGEGILELKLNALEKENLLSIIASPHLIASHENPASIQQGTEIPYVTSSEKKTQVQFKDAVLGMEVTPTITRDEHVKLLLKISHNSPDTALTTSENHHLAINKQEIATSVTIKNNETLILGGIFQQKQEKTKSGLPFLSNIPLLGELFTNTGEHIDRRVLVIFITPKLVNI